MATTVTLSGFYPVTSRSHRALVDLGLAQVRAQPTGEYRPPRKGEWYLSGAIVEAYRAPNDLASAFHIAQIVRVRLVTTVEVLGVVVMDDETAS